MPVISVVSQMLCNRWEKCPNRKCIHRIPHNDDTCFTEPNVFYCPHVSGKPSQCRPLEEFFEQGVNNKTGKGDSNDQITQ